MNNTKVDVSVKCKEKKVDEWENGAVNVETKDKNNTKHVPVETQHL